MTRPVIIIDLNGALLKSRPFDTAHKEWFKVMGELIRDYTINELAFKEDYFADVQEIMKKYLGDINIKTRNAFARNIYSMMVVESIKKWDLIDDFAEYLRSIKKKFSIVLITSAPGPAVNGILEKVHCQDLFDIIAASSMDEVPSKKDLIESFIHKHGKPLFYIGQGDKDIDTCKNLGIKTVVVDWVAPAAVKGNFEAHNITELDKILERHKFEHDSKI
jgi:phosphoglycolate phosphatase-like HAD superfamily hydrolase